MTRTEIFDEVRDIIVRSTDVPEREGDRTGSAFFEDPNAIRMETRLDELGLDSLAVTAVAVGAESRFGITLSPVLMFDVRTVGDLVTKIEEAVTSREAS